MPTYESVFLSGASNHSENETNAASERLSDLRNKMCRAQDCCKNSQIIRNVTLILTLPENCSTDTDLH